MAKNLASQALKKKNMLSNVAHQSQKLSKELEKAEDVKRLPADIVKQIVYLKDDMLVDDPYNQEVYGELENDGLAEAMKEHGFQGVIVAYPYEGKYMIESGHRRRNAAKKAGILEYPVYIAEPPKSESERRMRLFLGNLHGRKEKPLVVARVAEGLFETHKMDIEERKKQGMIEEGENLKLNELVAQDMELERASVELYRRLLKLIPELQTLANDERYAWSALAMASNLEEKNQHRLYEWIEEETKRSGSDAITRAWINKIIKRLKNEEKGGELVEAEEPKLNTRIRRKNGTKTIKSCAKMLHEVLDKDALIKENEVEEVVETLQKLKHSIEVKIEMLNKAEPNG